MSKLPRVMDHEVFPNFFSSTFIDRHSDKKHVFVIHENRCELKEFYLFVTRKCNFIMGFNNSKYDDIITNYIIENYHSLSKKKPYRITQIIYDLSQEIIDSQKGGKSIWWNKNLKAYIKKSKYYTSIDLMSVMAFDKNHVSLKQVAIALRWHKIQDLPKPFNESVKKEEVNTILDYNENDVLITKELAITVTSEIKIRSEIGKKYRVDIWCNSRSGIADSLLSKFWEDETGQKYWDFKNEKTERSYINIIDCLSSKISFKHPKLAELHQKLKDTIWYPKDDIKHKVIIGESRYDILLGGLHSNNPPMIVENSDKVKIIDFDFGSYYPYLMINLNIYPEHLSEQFLELFKIIVEQRIKAKNNGEKLEADALKIVINSTYGKLNFDFGWLKDTKASYSVTLNGQLFLLMLIEQLEEAGIDVFYANTDGITAKVPIEFEEKYYEICNNFGKYVNIPVEYAEYKKCVIRDVNNYSIETIEGKIKEKGVFVRDLDVKSTFLTSNYTCSYNKPIVALALYEYFHNGVPIEKFITEHEDIYDFCMAQKVGAQFTVEKHSLNKDKTKIIIDQCQKTNRYYVTTRTSKLYKKRKDNGSLNDLAADYNIEIFNDFVDEKDYNINYNYYISVTQKIIDVLEPKQLTLTF